LGKKGLTTFLGLNKLVLSQHIDDPRDWLFDAFSAPDKTGQWRGRIAPITPILSFQKNGETAADCI
jgi:hypothetical protein